MKYLILFMLPLVDCGSENQSAPIGINTRELSVLIEKEDVQLIDIRTTGEVSQGIIKGAKHIDYYKTDFMSRIESLDKNQPVVLYCAVGGRSARAAHMLIRVGFQTVYDYRGGIREWVQTGNQLSR